MKDSYSFDVDDAGLRARPTTRTATPTSRSSTGSASTTSSSRRCPARWAARRARSSSRRPRSARTPTSAARRATTPPTSRRSRRPRPPPLPYDDAPAAHVEDTPDTPTIDTLVDHANDARTRARRPAVDGGRHAEERRRHARAPRRHARAARDRPARRPRGRPEAARGRSCEPAEVEPFDEADFAAAPGLVKGYIGPAVLGETSASRHPLPLDPRVVDGTALGHRRRTSPASTSSTWSPAATSPPTARSRRPRCATATPCPTCGGALEIARGIEIGHIFQLGRKYAEALGLRCSTRTASWSPSRWAPTASASPARSPRSPSRPTTSSGLCWPREVAPADVHLVATGKDDAVFDGGRGARRRARRPRACACSTTTGARSRPA